MCTGKHLVNEEIREILLKFYEAHDLSREAASNLLYKLRLLTREKTIESDLLDKKCIQLLVDNSSKCQVEAQKCLSNLILNYTHIRDLLIDPYVSCVKTRLSSIRETSEDQSEFQDIDMVEILYFDLRIIFLISALCSASRSEIRDQLLDPILEMTKREAAVFSSSNYLLVVECLKTIFNLTLDRCTNSILAGDVIVELFKIAGTEQDKINGELELTDQLLVNLIHLMTNMQEDVYKRLSDQDADKVLNFLDSRLTNYSKQNFRETILPVLNVCKNICKFRSDIRRRWFNSILASTKEFEKRPEEYDDMRGRLVKLMTSVDVHIKDVAAELMHVLCDGDTEKLITYTGFGNSASFLSSRGILTEGLISKGDGRGDECNEYLDLRKRIDPITGKLETPKKNPMEGMSEEEKEYHAHELADAITKLTNLGVMKPMTVNQDTKVRPATEHARKHSDN